MCKNDISPTKGRIFGHCCIFIDLSCSILTSEPDPEVRRIKTIEKRQTRHIFLVKIAEFQLFRVLIELVDETRVFFARKVSRFEKIPQNSTIFEFPRKKKKNVALQAKVFIGRVVFSQRLCKSDTQRTARRPGRRVAKASNLSIQAAEKSHVNCQVGFHAPTIKK